MRDLQEVFPEAAAARCLRGRVVTDPQSVFSVTTGMQDARPAGDLFANHRVWLAGDWTDTGWPATMEGAVRSGFLAAAQSIASHRKIAANFIASDLPRSRWVRWLIRD